MPRRTLRDYRAFTNVPGVFGDRPESEVHRIPATTPSPEESFADTRTKFSERLKEQLGFDPVAFDPAIETRRISSARIPALVERMFGRGATIEGVRSDPGKMAFFQKHFGAYQKKIFSRLSAKQKRFRSEYDTAIKAFDVDVKARKATKPLKGITVTDVDKVTKAYNELFAFEGDPSPGKISAFVQLANKAGFDVEEVGERAREGKGLFGSGTESTYDLFLKPRRVGGAATKRPPVDPTLEAEGAEYNRLRQSGMTHEDAVAAMEAVGQKTEAAPETLPITEDRTASVRQPSVVSPEIPDIKNLATLDRVMRKRRKGKGFFEVEEPSPSLATRLQVPAAGTQPEAGRFFGEGKLEEALRRKGIASARKQLHRRKRTAQYLRELMPWADDDMIIELLESGKILADEGEARKPKDVRLRIKSAENNTSAPSLPAAFSGTQPSA